MQVFDPATLLCLLQASTWTSNVTCLGHFVYSEFSCFGLLILVELVAFNV
jgi:hypothetical protein